MTTINTLIALSAIVDATAAKYGMEGDVEHAAWLAFEAKAREDNDLLIGAEAFAKACIAEMTDGLTEARFIVRYSGRIVESFTKVVTDAKSYRAAMAAKRPNCTVQYVSEVC